VTTTKYGNLKLADARALFLLENDFAWRHRAAPYHDFHHIITEYPCTIAGEVQAAAWELAAGRFRNPFATLFCLPLVALGALRWPGLTFRAFVRGRRSSTLYAEPITRELLATRVSALQERLLPAGAREATPADVLAYCGLLFASFALVSAPAAAAALLYCGVAT